jgi:hypothetical protein
LPECSSLTQQLAWFRKTRLYLDEQRFSTFYGDATRLHELVRLSISLHLEMPRKVLGFRESQPLVLKDPMLSEVIEELEIIFPDHKHLCVIRDPLDVIASLKKVYLRKEKLWSVQDATLEIREGHRGILRAYMSASSYTSFAVYEEQTLKREIAVEDFGLTRAPYAKESAGPTTVAVQAFDKEDPFFSEFYLKPTTSERVGFWRSVLSSAEADYVRSEFFDFRSCFGYST